MKKLYFSQNFLFFLIFYIICSFFSNLKLLSIKKCIYPSDRCQYIAWSLIITYLFHSSAKILHQEFFIIELKILELRVLLQFQAFLNYWSQMIDQFRCFDELFKNQISLRVPLFFKRRFLQHTEEGLDHEDIHHLIQMLVIKIKHLGHAFEKTLIEHFFLILGQFIIIIQFETIKFKC